MTTLIDAVALAPGLSATIMPGPGPDHDAGRVRLRVSLTTVDPTGVEVYADAWAPTADHPDAPGTGGGWRIVGPQYANGRPLCIEDLSLTMAVLHWLRDAGWSDPAHRTDAVVSEVGATTLASAILDAFAAPYLARAKAAGAEAATLAATWAVDGNASADHVRYVLGLMADGDPRADEFLPARPDLSGEYSDDPTPMSLARNVLAGTCWTSVDHDPPAWLVDLLADAYEDGVADAFGGAVEAELRKWVDSGDADDQPRLTVDQANDEVADMVAQQRDDEHGPVIALAWDRAEWADDEREQASYAHGYEASVRPDDDRGDWWWIVRVTSEISEYPEVQDCGHAADEDGAKEAARVCITRAVAA